MKTEQDNYEQIMEGDLSKMSDIEVARTVEVLLNRYIPNMVASCSHPDSIRLYRLRAIDAMDECVLRLSRAIHANEQYALAVLHSLRNGGSHA